MNEAVFLEVLESVARRNIILCQVKVPGYLSYFDDKKQGNESLNTCQLHESI
jgi:hypothetical protein